MSYLNELDKKILELDRYPQDYDDSEYIGVKNIRDLFKLSANEDYYKSKLTKSGYMVITPNMKVKEIEYYQFKNISL